jgi:hypothetical protein
MTIQLSSSALRSTTAAGAGATVTARAFLYTNNLNTAYTFSAGTTFVETTVSVDGGSMKIENIPAGTDYRLLLVVGQYNNLVFVPGDYGLSGSFPITAGKTSSVALTLQSSPITGTALLGSNINGVGYDGYNLYATDSSTLYSATSPSMSSPTFDQSYSAPSGMTINSLSNVYFLGSSAVWVNTSGGIVLPGEWPTLLPFTTVPPGNVTRSDSFGIDGVNGGVIYRSGFLLRGGLAPVDGSAETWFDIDMSDGSTTQPVLDFSVTQFGLNDFVYLAAGASTFAAPADFMNAGNRSLDYMRNAGVTVRVVRNGKSLFTTSTAIDDPTFVSSLPSLYVGTVNSIALVSDGSIMYLYLLSSKGISVVEIGSLTGYRPRTRSSWQFVGEWFPAVGGSKVNVSTELKHVWIDSVFEYLSSHRDEYDPGKNDTHARTATSSAVRHWIDLLGSSGQVR